MGAEWLEKLFLQILQMSLWGTYCIVAVMILRLLLKRQPKIFSYLLWLIVAFRLICPVSFESEFSGFQYADREIAASQGTQNIHRIAETGKRNDKRVPLSEGTVQTAETEKPMIAEREIGENRQVSVNVQAVGSVVWVMGMAGMLLYMLYSTLKLQTRLKSAVKKTDYYETEQIESPFVFGIVRPRIYFPVNLREDEIAYILEHERTHIRRKDYLIKLMAFFILSVHWFNPLVWIAFSCMTKDMEMSCDEAVLTRMGKEIKQSYSTSLLFLASKERFIGAGPLAFGETGVKSRVKNILNYRKPGFWGILAAIVLLLAAGVVLMSDPKKPEEKEKQEAGRETQSVVSEIDKEAEKEKLDIENAQAKDLEYCITQAILSGEAKDSEAGEFQTEAHHNMKIVENSGEVTVYTHVLYQRWKNMDETGRGSYIPTAITFTKDEKGRYQLKEYWIPKDGGDFKPSIEEKFPEDIWEETWNHQEYIEALEEECKQKATDYFNR